MIHWPQPFEDGDVWTFLEDFEEVVDAAGLDTDRGKLAALKTLLRVRVEGGHGCGQEGPLEDGLSRREGSPCSGVRHDGRPPGGYEVVQDDLDGTWM
ncbi:hypothetical protein CLF_113615 [Clonorchis sinensis]|uniref:Uncharacterized protein n=1 Tax=Clonorchis sinensis TaxID=79923 RepID=G7YMX0_CLOSI|nr:hypothetical protein CLF_113615 [Clonorchis sinensis]